MNLESKGTLLAILGVVFFVIAVVVGIELFVYFKGESAEELYVFATSATYLHQKIEGDEIINQFDGLLERVLNETPEEGTDIEQLIRHGLLSAGGYTEQFYWVIPTDESLWLWESLLKEGQLLENAYARLNSAWSAKLSGNEIACMSYCEEAQQLFDDFKYWRARNRIDLKNLAIHTEQELER